MQRTLAAQTLFFCNCRAPPPPRLASCSSHTDAPFTTDFDSDSQNTRYAMHLPTRVREERAASPTDEPLPLDHPIHSKKPPIVDPLPVKRDEDEAVLPLDHPIHSKRPPIVDPLPIKRDDEPTPTVLPLDHPIHSKKPPIVDPLPIKRATATPTETVLPLDHPIHSKKPPIVDPLPVKREVPTETVLPLDHPIHSKKPPIVDPLPVDPWAKRDDGEAVIPLDHPIHKKKPAIVDPLPVDPYPAKRNHDTLLPLDHPIHNKKPAIVDPLPVDPYPKRDDEPDLPLDHPIHKKKPAIVDPLPVDPYGKRDDEPILPLDHPIHKKKPAIVDPLPVDPYPKRDEDALPLDHPIHKKKPAIVDPLPVDPYPKREVHRDAPWKREDRGGAPSAEQNGPAAQGGPQAVAASNPQTLINELPRCVRACLFRAPAGECRPEDFECLCNNEPFLKAVLVSVVAGHWRTSEAVPRRKNGSASEHMLTTELLDDQLRGSRSAASSGRGAGPVRDDVCDGPMAGGEQHPDGAGDLLQGGVEHPGGDELDLLADPRALVRAGRAVVPRAGAQGGGAPQRHEGEPRLPLAGLGHGQGLGVEPRVGGAAGHDIRLRRGVDRDEPAALPGGAAQGAALHGRAYRREGGGHGLQGVALAHPLAQRQQEQQGQQGQQERRATQPPPQPARRQRKRY